MAVGDFLPVKHTYKKGGVYRVTLSGVCNNLYGLYKYDISTSNGNKLSTAVSKWLWGVAVPKDSTSPLQYAYGSFFGCQGLKYLGYGVFHNITKCKEVPHLYDGATLARIEPWMLYGGYNLESIAYTFENCQMIEIDKDVFKHCSKVTNAEHAFHRCTSLVKLPKGLLNPLINLENASLMFKSCTNLLEIEDGEKLFDACTKLTNVEECFCGGGYHGDASYSSIMKIKSALPSLWLRSNITNHSAYAKGCKYAANYTQAVIHGWT